MLPAGGSHWFLVTFKKKCGSRKWKVTTTSLVKSLCWLGLPYVYDVLDTCTNEPIHSKWRTQCYLPVSSRSKKIRTCNTLGSIAAVAASRVREKMIIRTADSEGAGGNTNSATVCFELLLHHNKFSPFETENHMVGGSCL